MSCECRSAMVLAFLTCLVARVLVERQEVCMIRTLDISKIEIYLFCKYGDYMNLARNMISKGMRMDGKTNRPTKLFENCGSRFFILHPVRSA